MLLSNPAPPPPPRLFTGWLSRCQIFGAIFNFKTASSKKSCVHHCHGPSIRNMPTDHLSTGVTGNMVTDELTKGVTENIQTYRFSTGNWSWRTGTSKMKCSRTQYPLDGHHGPVGINWNPLQSTVNQLKLTGTEFESTIWMYQKSSLTFQFLKMFCLWKYYWVC